MTRLLLTTDRLGWGHNIAWIRPGERLVGWLTPVPDSGDEIVVSMESNKPGVYRLKNVKLMGDPRDMFAADTEWVGYTEK